MLSVGANVLATNVSGNIMVNMKPLTDSTDRIAEPTQIPTQIIANPKSSSRPKPAARLPTRRCAPASRSPARSAPSP